MRNNSNFEKFTGVYCSGFFIPDPSMLTTLCLLFDNIYLANNLEYLLDFVRKYKYCINDSTIIQKASQMILIPHEDCCDDLNLDDPLQGLSERELETAKVYMLHARSFFINNHELIGKVIKTSMLPNDEVFEVKLLKEGKLGELNTYEVTEKSFVVSMNGLSEFNDLINQGAVPVLGKYHVNTYTHVRENTPSKYLACLLAMKSIELILPAMKKAPPEVILEARDRLHDHLPLFWSSMLKLSTELKTKIGDNIREKDIIFETQEIVDTIVRPAIIELKQKLVMERKNWFYKILHPLYNGVKMFLGNPQLTTANLAITGLATGLNIANSFICQAEEVDKMKKEAGLTFLLRLDELIS